MFKWIKSLLLVIGLALASSAGIYAGIVYIGWLETCFIAGAWMLVVRVIIYFGGRNDLAKFRNMEKFVWSLVCFETNLSQRLEVDSFC